jgi:hypothetical protein
MNMRDDPSVYYKLFLYCYLCLSVQLGSLSCSFTSMSFLTTSCSFTFICVYVYNWIVSHVHLHPCPFLLPAVLLLLSVIQLYTKTQIKVKEQLVVRKDMDVNEHERLSNCTLRHR